MIFKIYKNVNVIFHINKDDINSTNLVYLLKFPNGLFYVGQTASKNGLSNRIRQHCCEAFTATKKTNAYKNNIIRRYKKIDVFILHKCKTLKEIDEYEIFYINILKKRIINLESGGNLRKKLAVETKEKIRNSNNSPSKKKYGKVEVYNLDGTLFKIFNNTSEAAKYFNSNHVYMYRACNENFNYKGFYQFKWEKSNKIIKDFSIIKNENNNLRRQKLSLTINGEKKYYDKLYKYDKNGYLLNEVSIFDLSVKEINGIRNSIKHNTFYKKEYWSIFMAKKIDVPKSRYEKVSEKKSKSVLQLDENLNIIKKWKSITDAANGVGSNTNNIVSVCKHQRRKAKGFVWCYANDYDNFKINWETPIHRFRKDTKKGRIELGLE